MITIFDFFALALMAMAMALFVYRYIKQDPPVYPYLVISVSSLVASWLGNAGGGVPALMMLIAAAFSFAGCVLYPSWRNMGG